MTGCDEADQHTLDNVLLAYNHLCDLVADFIQPGDCLFETRVRCHDFIVVHGCTPSSVTLCKNRTMAQTRGAVVSSIAAVGSLIAAMSCCLPVGTFLLAAGSAGAARILTPLRPWLFAVSIAAL